MVKKDAGLQVVIRDLPRVGRGIQKTLDARFSALERRVVNLEKKIAKSHARE